MLTLVSEHRIYGCHKLKNQGGKCTQFQLWPKGKH